MGDELVGDCGVFWDRGIGRFRYVETKKSYRERGICATLVHHGSELAMKRDDVEVLVMEADEDYVSARIYERVGYRKVERIGSFCQYDQSVWKAGGE